MREPRWAAAAMGVAIVLWAITGSADSRADLKSKDFRKRLAAVAALRAEGGEDAEKLLLSALKDPDWEVVERAVEALSDHGGKKAAKALVKIAAEGPVRRIRLAAAATLARLGSEVAAKGLAKHLRRDAAVNAAEALAVLARAYASSDAEQLRKALAKAMKAKEAPVRAAVAGALRAFPAEERLERFQNLLDDTHITVVAAALDGLRAMPDPVYLPAVAQRLARPVLNDVITRRAIAAFDAILAAQAPRDRLAAVPILERLVGDAVGEPRAATRVARLVGILGSPLAPAKKPAKESAKKGAEKPPAAKKDGESKADPKAKDDAPAPAVVDPKLEADTCLRLLEGILGQKDEGARAAAVRALQRIHAPEAIDRAATFLTDPHPRVRFQALRAVVAARGVEHRPTFEQVTERLEKDPDASVREEAAVLLGRSGAEGAPFAAPVDALAKALSDNTWSVAVVAAVSLGKTRAETAVKPLAAMLDRKAVKDWRLRAAAVVGLGKLRLRPAVPHLIRALKDRDAWVRRNAFEFLRRLTKRTIYAEFDEWTLWWKRFGPTYEFEDREKTARLLKQGGYATKPVDVYDKGKAALDVVVLQSRGDHIEKLLEDLRIDYRVTRAAQVDQADVHSFAVFVSNCTGEIQKRDIERLQWFVRVGGYLFCSCWALHHTVEPVYPGLVRKLPTKGEVLDNVMAAACPGDSPYLEGVFRPWARPIYVLYGAHLIDVLQPERVEVLMDSPQAAARWGGGNIACWFPAGHGVILDSANHFDLQGLERVTGLKTAEDRMAYAMDHMGLDYPELRQLAASGVWSRQADAVKLVRDLSAFRFITNFARLKRRKDP